MNCPTCQTELRISERQGIEIDYCPRCRGVWLDRGELDKIIERTMMAQPVSTGLDDFNTQPGRHRRDEGPDDSGFYPAHRPAEDRQRASRPKRKSFLGELFDFD